MPPKQSRTTSSSSQARFSWSEEVQAADDNDGDTQMGASDIAPAGPSLSSLLANRPPSPTWQTPTRKGKKRQLQTPQGPKRPAPSAPVTPTGVESTPMSTSMLASPFQAPLEHLSTPAVQAAVQFPQAAVTSDMLDFVDTINSTLISWQGKTWDEPRDQMRLARALSNTLTIVCNQGWHTHPFEDIPGANNLQKIIGTFAPRTGVTPVPFRGTAESAPAKPPISAHSAKWFGPRTTHGRPVSHGQRGAAPLSRIPRTSVRPPPPTSRLTQKSYADAARDV